MQLLFAPPSPYARKVRVLARELNLLDDLEEIAVHTTPLTPAAEVTTANPLSKIPTLITNDAESLYDSRVICAYLSALATARASASSEARPLSATPKRGDSPWQVMRCHALADGILDAGLLHRYETLFRPPELHWQPWLDAQYGKIARGLAQLALEVPSPSGAVDVDAIAIACALSWLDFRLPDIGWRKTHPALESFHVAMSERPSMVATRP